MGAHLRNDWFIKMDKHLCLDKLDYSYASPKVFLRLVIPSEYLEYTRKRANSRTTKRTGLNFILIYKNKINIINNESHFWYPRRCRLYKNSGGYCSKNGKGNKGTQVD
jgi:hypothetical protein